MNSFKGIVHKSEVFQALTKVDVRLDDLRLTTVVLTEANGQGGFDPGQEIDVLFKETEVILVKGNPDTISLRNRFEGVVVEIAKEAPLCQVTVNTQYGDLRSIVTLSALEELKLKEGDRVWAMIKANELILM